MCSFYRLSFLFDIAIQVAKEATLTSTKDSVKECIEYVNAWFAARKKLQELPEELQVRASLAFKWGATADTSCIAEFGCRPSRQ
jgi:hypothetical protein